MSKLKIIKGLPLMDALPIVLEIENSLFYSQTVDEMSYLSDKLTGNPSDIIIYTFIGGHEDFEVAFFSKCSELPDTCAPYILRAIQLHLQNKTLNL